MRLKLGVAAAVVLLALTTVTPAFAQYVGGTTPVAGHSSTGSHSSGSPFKAAHVRVGGVAPQNSGSRGLALTGADIAELLVLGGLFVVGGAALTRGARRRRALSPS